MTRRYEEMAIGDVYLIVDRNDTAATAANVSKLTKTQFRVTLPSGKEAGPFKREAYTFPMERADDGGYRYGICHEAASKYDSSRAYPEKHRGDVERRIAAAKERREAKRAAEEDRLAKIRAREAAELAEVKEAFGGEAMLAVRTRVRDTMPDGTRMLVIDLPVKPELAERRGGWSRAIVKLKDTREPDWSATREAGEERYVTRVEMYLTYTDGGSSSWPSCSGEKFDTDDEAVWEALRYVYHRW